MSETTLLTIAGIIFVGGPLTVIAWAIVLEWRGDRALARAAKEAAALWPEQPPPGDQSHHPGSIEQARRANGRRADA